jgi:DNA modification methylase
MIELIHDNCFNYIETDIKCLGKKVDLIISDPPYELLDEEFICRLNNLYIKILSNDGILIWFSKEPYHGMVQYLTRKKFTYVNDFIWFHRDAGGFRSKKQPRITHHYIHIFSECGYSRIDLDQIRIPYPNGIVPPRQRKGNKFRGRYGKDFYWEPHQEGRWPISVLEFNASQPEELKSLDTPIGVKPLELIKRLVKGYSDVDSVVLDPFMGAGTVGLCCKTLNRNYIGIEKENKYYELSWNRIQPVQTSSEMVCC